MMGKDKIGPPRIPSFTKSGKKQDNIKLTRELDDLKKSYQDVYSVVEHLADEYQRSKANLMSTRYGQLKCMIKNATSDEILERTLPPSERDHKQKTNAAVTGLLKSAKAFAGGDTSGHAHSSSQHSGISKQRQTSTKTGNLLDACKQFAGAADEATATKDLDDMTKREVSSDNKEKKQHIIKYDTKFLRLHNRLEKLKREYQDSKEHSFVQRYNLMKEMIKTVIKDDSLKPDK